MIFFVHGMLKFGSMGQTIAAFSQLGVLQPTLAAPFIATLELVGGLVLILGLGRLTRLAAFLLTIMMLVATILIVTHTVGFVGGYEYNVALLGGLLALMLTGPGYLALIHEKTRPPKPAHSLQ
jgi:putative oxidoreductase